VGYLVKEAKANVNAKDKDSTTALMAAAVRGHKEVSLPSTKADCVLPDVCRLHGMPVSRDLDLEGII
jgi:ankyrin repeat protein